MRRSLIGGKDFHNFNWTRKISSRRGHGKVGDKKKIFISFFLRRGK
jgi:hypothetical protein